MTHTPRDRRIRIGDWLVPYDDAKTPVTLARSMKDVLTAVPGDDQNCMNSRCIMAHRRERVFPHPVYLVSTIKSRVYVVDEIDDLGQPLHAVRYELSERDSRLIGEHDKYGSGQPGELRLKVPRDKKGSPKYARSPEEVNASFQRSGGGKGEPYKGNSRRAVTSVGAKARYKVAVGSLVPD